MPLKQQVQNLDEVEEKHRDLYVERDGKFFLDADEPKELKNALERERSTRKTAEQAVKELTEKYGDLDPEAAREALERVNDFEKKQHLEKGEVDKLIESEISKAIKDHKKKLDKAEGELRLKDARLSKLLIDNAIKDAALKPEIAALPEALPTIALIGKEEWQLDESGKPVAMKDDKPVLNDDGDPISIIEWVANLKSTHKYLFAQPAGGGAGGGYLGQPVDLVPQLLQSLSESQHAGNYSAPQGGAQRPGSEHSHLHGQNSSRSLKVAGGSSSSPATRTATSRGSRKRAGSRPARSEAGIRSQSGVAVAPG